MLKYVFQDGNLILLENSKDSYDISFFDEHIPYKNLLIKNFKVFCCLENILNEPYFLNTFKVILNEMNIKSLIINGNIGGIIPYNKYHFRILSFGLLKSLVIANFDSPARSFLYELDSVIDKNIEFLSLRKLAISKYTVETLLMKEKLKGLVFNMVQSTENLYRIQYLSYSNLGLEYINFRYVLINNSWWNGFFRCGVAKKIIIEFDNLYTEKNFMDEFIKIESYRGVLNLQIRFFDVKILTDFCDSLSNFNDIKTSKLDRYVFDKETYDYLLRIVESMQQLENLTLIQVINDAKYYNFSLKHFNIKSLDLENCSLNNKIVLEDFLGISRSLSKLFLL
ncbi:hypothetical protein CWI39_0091p0020 [Hamiltosporidium magnivora]|uniref:Uncharacterized protein n=1 Tax=Hamiltosporidium magnivora TaxID=148818 RepID=A0A4Q9LLU5_9MICR|nr:hypothetical protein CWI39_0091p0020 [Hamiltosporidium magnivora]